jgi:hypothetical protein
MSTKNTKTSNKTSSVNEEFFARRRIQDHFTQIPNAIITYQMSFAAHWLITYLLYHPPFNKDGSKWNPNSEYLIKLFKQRNVGKHTYYNALNELIELGYVLREHIMVGNIRQGIRYEYDFEPVFKEQNNIEKIKSNTKSKKMFPTSQFSASRGEGSIYNTKVQNNTRENNTKESNPTEIPLEYPKLKKPKTKTATAPSSPIIIFLKYEWFNEKTGIYQHIETGMTEIEYEIGKNKIGESNFYKAINKIQSFLDEPKNPYRYSDKNLLKKVLKTHKDGLVKEEDKKQKQKEQDLREGIKYVEEISEEEKLERYAKREFEIAKKFQYDNPDLRKYIRVLEKKDCNLVVHRKIEIMHCSKNNKWETIKTPEPRIEEKLEKWANDIRHYKL